MLHLHKAYSKSPDIQAAQTTAAGTMPAVAFQYCEAMRSASSYGWYVYPPKDISLLFNGAETYHHDDGQWFPLKSTNLEQEFRGKWDKVCPPELVGCDPPYLSELFVPGHVQIWSGYFAWTDPGWNVLIRPPVNFGHRNEFSCYEGLVETEHFQPFPLFINIKITQTDSEIYIPFDRPLFQVQLIRSTDWKSRNQKLDIAEGLSRDSGLDWGGLANTLRRVEDRDTRRPGTYAAKARKQGRNTLNKD